MTKAKKTQFVGIATLILAPALVYYNGLRNGFVFDDRVLVVQNLRIRDWHNLFSHFSLYRPLRWFTYTAEYYLWGLNPLGYHLTNILLHVSCTLLLYLLAVRLFKGRFVPLVIALLFAVHPIGTEAVNGIASRPDLLATVFLLSCLALYVRRTRSVWFYVLSVVSFGLALLSKEIVAIAIPVLLVGCDLCFDHGPKAMDVVRRNLRFYVPYGVVVALCVVAGWRRFAVSERVGDVSRYIEAGASSAQTSHTAILGTWGRAMCENLRLLVLPYNLCADYPFSHVSSIFDARVLLPLLVCLGFILLVVKTYAHWREVSFGLFWILVTLLPVSNIVPLTPHFVAERYLYAPSIGFCVILGVLLDRAYHLPAGVFPQRFQRGLAVFCLLLIVTSYSVLTCRRNPDWKLDYALWSKTVRQRPRSARAHANLGVAYHERGLSQNAIGELEKAIEISPGLAQAHCNLGVEYGTKGLNDEAIRELTRAIEISPGLAAAHCELGAAYKERGLWQEALEEYERATAIAPGLALAHLASGRYTETWASTIRRSRS